MLTYNRGQWIDDPNEEDICGYAPDEGVFSREYKNDLTYLWGTEFTFNIEVYEAKDKSAKFPYAALVGVEGLYMQVAIIDLPSVYMLVKEYLPIIQNDREKELHEWREEEHMWKAHDDSRYPRKHDDSSDSEQRCKHVLY